MAIREGLVKVFNTCPFCVRSGVGVGYLVCVGDCSVVEGGYLDGCEWGLYGRLCYENNGKISD